MNNALKESVSKHGQLAAARMSTNMKQKDMAKQIGCSIPTLINYEKNPESISLCNLRKYYRAVGLDGKEILKEFLSDFQHDLFLT